MRVQDALGEALKAAPPTSVSAMLLFGIPLSEWVIILNGVYIVLAIIHKIYKWKDSKDGS